MFELEDKSPMPYGKYKGTAMANVPAVYLLYIYNNAMSTPAVRKYIESNMDVLKQEVKTKTN
ncbi:MAG: DUF3820 family protein [Bacteroidales bacterium]|nr:DUF3820 family protein [Bacteroidales bacterium]